MSEQQENRIIKTSVLPKIIPPLPNGDTKDLKVWQEYWKQHDKYIRQSERESILNHLKEWATVRMKAAQGITYYHGISYSGAYENMLKEIEYLSGTVQL
jgi:hypothetical protein